MNFTLGPGQGGELVFVLALWSLFVTMFWMVVGGRAMRAHHELASTNRQLAEEIHQWRRSYERLAPKDSSPAAAAAEEVRISEMLMDRERKA